MPGEFYFMKDEFYSEFSDCGLMHNKESVNGKPANRPCFFSFPDKTQANIYWFIPISSKVEKYEKIYQDIAQKYGKCDKIEFGDVLGHRRAFLIQNIFPATKEYIDKQYMNNGVAVKTDFDTTKRIIQKAQSVLAKVNHGVKITFTNVNKIYSELVKKLNT